MIKSLVYLHYLVAVGPGIPVGDHVEGRQVARRIDVATRNGEGATQRRSLSTRHPDGAPVAVEEEAAAVTKALQNSSLCA
jgi:hypothetical protein